MSTFNIPVITLPNLVFFPNTSVPLFIIDETCIQMIKQAESSRSLVALSLANEFEAVESHLLLTPKKICTAGHPQVLEELKDGTIKVLLSGVCKIELLAPKQDIPYPIYEASIIEEKSSHETSFLSGELERINFILNSWLENNIKDSIERETFESNIKSIYEAIDYTCMFLIKDLEVKQILLENNSLSERVHLLNTLLKGQLPLKEDFIVSQALKSYEGLERPEVERSLIVNH